MFVDDFVQVAKLSLAAGGEQGFARVRACKTLIDDPGVRFDFSPAQICLQGRRLVNGSCLRQSDQENLGKVGIAQPRQELVDIGGIALASTLATGLGAACVQ